MTYAAAVVSLASGLWGDNWAALAHDALGINPRTLARIKAAAARGQDYAAARGVLEAIARKCGSVADEIDGLLEG